MAECVRFGDSLSSLLVLLEARELIFTSCVLRIRPDGLNFACKRDRRVPLFSHRLPPLPFQQARRKQQQKCVASTSQILIQNKLRVRPAPVLSLCFGGKTLLPCKLHNRAEPFVCLLGVVKKTGNVIINSFFRCATARKMQRVLAKCDGRPNRWHDLNKIELKDNIKRDTKIICVQRRSGTKECVGRQFKTNKKAKVLNRE